FNLHYSVGELKKMGVQIDADIADPVLGVVFPLEVSAGNTQYWLGLQNFYTITRYNKSTLYATAVAQLSQDIAQRRGAQLAAQ
ncbi:MAG: lytic murein transglycosylase, partial [Microvirgula sp.]